MFLMVDLKANKIKKRRVILRFFYIVTITSVV